MTEEHTNVEQVTEEDLRWWLDFAPTLDWIWAKTYADSAPHHYVTSIDGRTPGLTMEDCVRAARVIHTFGEPGKFHSYLNIYLYDRERGVKYWQMDNPLEKTDLINRAEADNYYGPQDAPKTAAPEVTFYDRVATSYDTMWQDEEDAKENRAMQMHLAQHFGAFAPSVLDVGCGTGLLLDLKITSPRIYTGIDPSQGMLNALVKKHSNVERLIPGTAAQALPTLAGERFDLVCSLFASPSYMTVEDWEAMVALSKDLTVFMTYEEGYLPNYWVGEEREAMLAQTEKARVDMIAFAERHDADRFKVGRFDVTWVKR